MEQSRRFGLRVALIVGLLGASAAVVALLWPRPEHLEGHAFAIPLSDRRVVIEVLNGTQRQGLARAAARVLRRQGLDVVFFGNADSAVASTRVLVRRGASDRGRAVAEALGAAPAAVTVARDTLRRVDVSVILGNDFHPPGEFHP